MESMKVLTLNTWGIRGPAQRRPLLLQAIRQINADILLLQEATDPALLEELDYPTRHHTAEGWLAILSRYPDTGHRSVTYSTVSPVEPYRRQALFVHLDVEGTPLWVVNTHLSWKAEDSASRRAQAEELVRLCGSLEGPVLAGGDFNAAPAEPPIRMMREAGFSDLFAALHPEKPGITWDNRNLHIQSHTVRFPDRRIDYLLLRGKELKPARCEVVCDVPAAGGLCPSDHYGVLADLQR